MEGWIKLKLKRHIKSLRAFFFFSFQNKVLEIKYKEEKIPHLLRSIQVATFIVFLLIINNIFLFFKDDCLNFNIIIALLNMVTFGVNFIVILMKKHNLYSLCFQTFYINFIIKGVLSIVYECRDSNISPVTSLYGLTVFMIFGSCLGQNWFILTVLNFAMVFIVNLLNNVQNPYFDMLLGLLAFSSFSYSIQKMSRNTFLNNYKMMKSLEQFKLIFQKLKKPILLMKLTGEIILENDSIVELKDSTVDNKPLYEYLKERIDSPIISSEEDSQKFNNQLTTNYLPPATEVLPEVQSQEPNLDYQNEFEITVVKGDKKYYFKCLANKYEWEEIDDTILFFLKDVTVEKNYNQYLEDNSEFKDLMISTVSHDIRTPLNCSITMTKICLERTNDPVLKEHLTFSLKSSAFLLAIVSDLLDYSQMNANKFKLNNSLFSIEELISDIKGYFEIIMKEKKISLIIDCSIEPSQEFVSDKDRIERILVNFISNSIKFTKVGFIKLTIVYNDGTGELEISVEDTGVGISFEDKKKLFKLWGKLNRADNNRHGIGLGLTISNMIVCALNNRSVEDTVIEVTSELGRGTTLSFKFPILIQNLSINSIENIRIDVKEGNLNTRGTVRKLESQFRLESKIFDQMERKKKILIIEDEETNLYVMKTLLERSKVKFEHCYNGSDAVLKILKASNSNKYFPLIISDINMPVMNGFQFAKWIREFEKRKFKTTLIACSANITNKDKECFLDSGFNDYLLKPIEISKLEAIVKPFRRGSMEIILE